MARRDNQRKQPGNRPSAKSYKQVHGSGVQHTSKKPSETASNVETGRTSNAHPSKDPRTSKTYHNAHTNPRTASSRVNGSHKPQQQHSQHYASRPAPHEQKSRSRSQQTSHETPSSDDPWTRLNVSPTVKVEGEPQPNRFSETASAAGAAALSGLGRAGQAAGRGLARGGSAFANLLRSSRTALIVTIVVCLVAVGLIVDFANTNGRAYSGVSIGGIDVSNMTASEIRSTLQNEYDSRISLCTVNIFASEEAEQSVYDEMANQERTATAEQISIEEARANQEAWTANAETLGARIDYDKLVDEALAVGRENGGLGARLHALLFGDDISVSVDFSESSIESLASDIDSAIGDARIDANITVNGSQASVVSGHDGYMVDRSELASQISDALLSGDESASFVAQTHYSPSRISENQAQAACDMVNKALSSGATFNFNGASWTVDASTIGSWVETEVVSNDSGYELRVYLDQEAAMPIIMANILSASSSDEVQVSFSQDDDGTILVTTMGASSSPRVNQAVEDLDEALFGENGRGNTSEDMDVSIDVTENSVASSMTLDEAIDIGIVSVIGTYTTEYSTYSGTENRNNNIHLAADLINNTIVTADGGQWSFNDRAGDCNEERGFKAAGSIIGNEFTDSIGGGICQVATTVFNAVYEAGLPVVSRTNHSLYISSYPAGRDAAVDYPSLDLVWENDLQSDVLLTMSYTDSTVTATLYSAPTGYSVTSELGEWVDGESYETIFEEDDTLASGSHYTKTVGEDGHSISVVRTVRNAKGEVISTDRFDSVYEAKDEVIVVGPNTDTSGLGTSKKDKEST